MQFNTHFEALFKYIYFAHIGKKIILGGSVHLFLPIYTYVRCNYQQNYIIRRHVAKVAEKTNSFCTFSRHVAEMTQWLPLIEELKGRYIIFCLKRCRKVIIALGAIEPYYIL